MLRRVHTGDKLRIPAVDYNALVDATLAQKHRSVNLGRRHAGTPRTDTVLVRNDSGTDRDRFDVLGIEGPILDPALHPSEILNRVTFACVEATEVDHAQRFVVLAEPIMDGGVCPAYCDGVCVARVWVNVGDEGLSTAGIVDGVPTLAAKRNGPVAILWKESGTGIKLAYVKLSGSGAGGSAAPVGVLGRIVPGSQAGLGSGGTAPYLYDIYPAPLVYPFAPDTSTIVNGVYNIAEIMGTTYGGRHLEDHALVQYFQLSSGVYYCEQSYYRGTYPG